MNDSQTKSPIANIRWLLVALAVVLGALIAYGVPDLLGDSQDSTDRTPQADGQDAAYRMSQVDVSDLQKEADKAEGALENNPRDIDALAAAGKAYLDMAGRLKYSGGFNDKDDLYRSAKAAVDYHRRYLDLRPDDYGKRIGLGLSYSYLDMNDIAERELVAATVAAPTSQRAWLSLGFIQNTAGKYEEARISLQKAVDIDPESGAGKEAQNLIDSILTSASHPTVTTP